MPNFCHGCGNRLEDDMSYCPGCGAPVDLPPDGQAHRPVQSPGYASFPGPYPMAPLPFPYAYPHPYAHPYPMYYRPPLSGQRIAAISGGCLMLVDGILALILGFILLVMEEEIVIGLLLIAAFVLSLIGAISVFRSVAPIMSLVGGLMLTVAGVSVMFLVAGVGIIGIVLAAISLGLIAIGWRDMRMREEMRRDPRSMPFHGQPPYQAIPPPPYGPGQDGVQPNIRK